MTPSRAQRAARNNAVWCDTICRAHGIPGEFHAALWLNRNAVPRFYSNAVMLSDGRAAAEQVARIRELIAAQRARPCSVKDSFCALDLSALDFQVLFEATWLWRAPGDTPAIEPAFGIRWTEIHNAAELTRWEGAWSRDAANHFPDPGPHLFLPALLDDRDVAFVAAYAGREIVAGAIANRSDGVVGLSNVFAPPDGLLACWTGCVAAVQARFPGLPVVGYERGPELAVAQAVGFEALQQLRVWLRPAQCAAA